MTSCNTKEDTVVPLLSGSSHQRPSLLLGQISDAHRLLNISKSREATPLTRPHFFIVEGVALQVANYCIQNN